VGLPVVIEAARNVSFLEPQILATALPVATDSLLVGSLLGLAPALLTGLVASFLAAYLTEMKLEFLALFLVSSIVAARSGQYMNRRGAMIRAGLMAGLANMIVVVGIRLIQTDLISLHTPFQLLAGLAGGLLSGIIVTGLLPLIETIFGYTTEVRLLELANLDEPVLKELLFQAPGSYHHSIIVANMVEAAAESIGANPLLAKVAAYYHDVGKTKKPLYFIENQGPGENRHEKLAPSMSALILIAHVKHGVEIARKAKLGRQI